MQKRAGASDSHTCAPDSCQLMRACEAVAQVDDYRAQTINRAWHPISQEVLNYTSVSVFKTIWNKAGIELTTLSVRQGLRAQLWQWTNCFVQDRSKQACMPACMHANLKRFELPGLLGSASACPSARLLKSNIASHMQTRRSDPANATQHAQLNSGLPEFVPSIIHLCPPSAHSNTSHASLKGPAQGPCPCCEQARSVPSTPTPTPTLFTSGL
eukprot:1015005-Pelagomonas_calceolata.AAC.3